MNLHDAAGLMIAGSRIKLPEWKGFWFIPQGVQVDGNDAYKAVRVFTRDGEVLDTPWFDKYKDREDFQLTEGVFGFDLALLAIENGHELCRKGWNGKNMFVYLISGIDLQTGLGYGFGEHLGEPTFTSIICLRSAQNTLIAGWKPTTPDLFAKDWFLKKSFHE